MTLSEIKSAIERGLTVCWSNENYQVIKDKCGQYLIKCLSNDHCIGLTWADETTLNGKEKDFFIPFDYSTLFNPDPAPLAPDHVAPVQPSREEQYQKTNFCKTWAPTYADAVAKLVKQYKNAQKQRDDWAGRVYVNNKKLVTSKAWSEFDQSQTTVYEANERRRKHRVRMAELTMKESIADLITLGLSTEEINQALAL